MSEDPIGFLGGPNFFTYATNRPSGAWDPYGLDWRVDFVRNSMIVGSIVGTMVGAGGGGAGGTLVAPVVGTIGGSLAGAAVGAAIGSGIILMADLTGRWWDRIDFDDDDAPIGGKQKNPQGDNTYFGRQIKEVLRQLGIDQNSDMARKIHDLIHNEGLKTVDEIVRFCKSQGFGGQ